MKKKFSKDNFIYDENGQTLMFGHDNLEFKTINMPKKQRFDNICRKFKLKKFIKKNSLFLPFIYISTI